MSIIKSKVVKKNVLLLLCANLFSFLVYYTVFYILNNQATLYIFYYFTEIVNTVLPLLAAGALFAVHKECGTNKCFLHALFYSLTWILYLFPYYAFEYAYQRIEIGAVLTFASIHALFMLIVIYIEITVLFLLMLFANEKFAKSASNTVQGVISATDFSSSETVAVFSAAAAMFVYNLVAEIIDTVSYIREVEGLYEGGEIVYIVFRYIFILLMLIGSHFATVFAINKTAYKEADSEKS